VISLPGAAIRMGFSLSSRGVELDHPIEVTMRTDGRLDEHAVASRLIAG
jgi:hypothetical protein